MMIYCDILMSMEKLTWDNLMQDSCACYVARVNMRGRDIFRLHTHDFAELFFIEHGEGLHEVNGQRQILRKGMLVMVRPDDVHGFRNPADEDLIHVNIAFPADTLDFMRNRYFLSKPAFFGGAGKVPECIQLSDSQIVQLKRAADDLAQSAKSRFCLERFLMNLFNELSGPINEAVQPGMPAWLIEACRDIRQREHFSGGCQSFIGICGRSPEHVAREVRRWMNLTPSVIVNLARMAYAVGELAMTQKPIIEISMDCGLDSLSHFYRLFRNHHGMTPKQYRSRNRSVAMR